MAFTAVLCHGRSAKSVESRPRYCDDCCHNEVYQPCRASDNTVFQQPPIDGEKRVKAEIPWKQFPRSILVTSS